MTAYAHGQSRTGLAAERIRTAETTAAQARAELAQARIQHAQAIDLARAEGYAAGVADAEAVTHQVLRERLKTAQHQARREHLNTIALEARLAAQDEENNAIRGALETAAIRRAARA